MTVAGLVADSDNGLGSPRGDVDDGLALIALFRSRLPIAAVASVFGNTDERRARANNRALAALCAYGGPILAGAAGPLGKGEPPSEAARFLLAGSGPWRIVALGPLTNLPRSRARWASTSARTRPVGSDGLWCCEAGAPFLPGTWWQRCSSWIPPHAKSSAP